MKFSVAALVGLLAVVGLAKPSITNTEFNVQEGKPFTLTWIDASGPVTITLVEGPDPDSLQPVRDIATGRTGSSFTFTPSGLPSGTYAFRITDTSGDGPNFSLPFTYVGTGTTSSRSSTGSSSSTTTRSGSSTTVTSSSSSSTGSSTSSTSTSRSTTTSSTSTRTTQTTVPTGNVNEGQRFSSPLALVFMTVAALLFFN